MTEEEAKIIENFKKFIKFKEDENDYLYESEEFYKDDIEQNELLLKMLYAVLNIIQKLQEENLNAKKEAEKKDMIINEMAEELITQFSHYEPCYLEFEMKCKKYKNCKDCIIQYFKNKAE